MLKAVNMKKYWFGKNGNRGIDGFGILDTESDTFVSFDGIYPYVLAKKKTIQSCIDAGWSDSLKRVKYTRYGGIPYSIEYDAWIRENRVSM